MCDVQGVANLDGYALGLDCLRSHSSDTRILCEIDNYPSYPKNIHIDIGSTLCVRVYVCAK